ncbi:DoxX family protein [Formosa sp. A9]|uniref:DoxX family protein n=1 Tax=Formosa sp. A9 TaxID=3442641 RepID=UPI003EB77513
MKHLLEHSAEILILIFLFITFLMSFLDKITDWNGNILFLKDYFSKSWLRRIIPLILVKVVIFEAITTILCALGIYEIIAAKTTTLALMASIFSCIILLVFLLGQRIAKDYDGARNIAIYFIIAVFAVYLFQ